MKAKNELEVRIQQLEGENQKMKEELATVKTENKKSKEKMEEMKVEIANLRNSRLLGLGRVFTFFII